MPLTPLAVKQGQRHQDRRPDLPLPEEESIFTGDGKTIPFSSIITIRSEIYRETELFRIPLA